MNDYQPTSAVQNASYFKKMSFHVKVLSEQPRAGSLSNSSTFNASITALAHRQGLHVSVTWMQPAGAVEKPKLHIGTWDGTGRSLNQQTKQSTQWLPGGLAGHPLKCTVVCESRRVSLRLATGTQPSAPSHLGHSEPPHSTRLQAAIPELPARHPLLPIFPRTIEQPLLLCVAVTFRYSPHHTNFIFVRNPLHLYSGKCYEHKTLLGAT